MQRSAATNRGKEPLLGNGLIFGRSPNLVLGALTAIFNVVVAFNVLGFNPSAQQIAVVNIALGALIALIANTNSIQTAAGEAAKARAAK